MKDINKPTKEDLIKEYNYILEDLWSKYSCDCLGFYIKEVHIRILELGGF